MQLLMRRPEMEGFISIAPPANLYDFSFLAPCPSCGLIIHGDKDAVVPHKVVTGLCDKLKTQKGIVIDQQVVKVANHFFDGKIEPLMQAAPLISTIASTSSASRVLRRGRGRHHRRIYLIRKASFLSFPAFISSRIQTGVAPRPAHVSFGSFLLRYFGATLRPFTDLRRPLLTPSPPPFPINASWLLSASAFFESTAPISSRSSSSASTDSFLRLGNLAIDIPYERLNFVGATISNSKHQRLNWLHGCYSLSDGGV
jgi:hypothetical protein